MNDRAAAASDEELALEARAGSRRSFEELAVRYGRKLSAFLGPKIASRQDVEDVSSWAYTAANRLAITHYRKLAKAKKLETAAAEMPAAASDHSAETSGANLWATARALPPAQYQALWLFYAEEMSIREVTRVMNKSSIAVRSLLHRGRLSLADLMGGAGHAAAHALTGPRRGKVVCFKENSG
jgi:RNA polymerase sigma factor (sigma-70 family)